MLDDIGETPSTTPNFQTELAAQLAVLIPEAIADGKVDVEKLKELLGSDTADTSERFGLFWPGKKRALRAAQEPTTATLKPDFENSKDWDTTQNVFIEGDNLEVLKILQKHYHAKIKLIYIDPPFPSKFSCCQLGCCDAAGRDRTQMATTEGSANPSRADFCTAA